MCSYSSVQNISHLNTMSSVRKKNKHSVVNSSHSINLKIFEIDRRKLEGQENIETIFILCKNVMVYNRSLVLESTILL